MKKNNRGLSLVELMVVVGMLSGLSLVVMNITKQSTKSSTKFQFDTDVTLTTNEINGILSDPVKCLTTLGSTATPTNIIGKYYISTISPGDKGYGNSTLRITSYTLTGTAPNGILTIAFENKNILKGSAGSATLPKKINVYIEGAPGAITKCRSLSTSANDIWSKLTPTSLDTYYLGNVSVGLTIPTAKLHVGGNLQVDGTINATGTITSASDKRLKKDFSSLNNSLEKILNLRGIEFSWRNKNLGRGRQIGFIAQEVEAIYPELISTNSQGMKSVAYQNMVVPLVEAIREQQIEIEILRAALCETNPNLKFCHK